MTKALLIVVFSTAFLFGPANSIMACTCRTFVGESDKELVVRAKAAADSIFVGRVVMILKEKDRRGAPTGDYIAVFNVTEMWKGKRRKQIRIVNGTDRCCLCEWRFTKGKEYLVFIDERNTNPSICGRTREIDDPEVKITRQYLGTSSVIQ